MSLEIDRNCILGSGSYGKVYKAKYGQLPCAAKVFHDTFSQNPVIITKFQQECQILSNLKHPNIVQCLGIMSIPMSVLLMELMDESLTRFLERSTLGLPYHSQLNICHDVALALAYLHYGAIIHRDLSSNNVLLIGEGSRAKVADFGMSKLNLPMAPLSQCPGTQAYMPPETFGQFPCYSYNLDIFSHGVLTIQIITRNLPNPVGPACFMTEADRRKEDIDLIEVGHPLRPIALHCIKDMDAMRPSANKLCEGLASLKNSISYRDSVEQTSITSLRQQLNLMRQQLNAMQQQPTIRTMPFQPSPQPSIIPQPSPQPILLQQPIQTDIQSGRIY